MRAKHILGLIILVSGFTLAVSGSPSGISAVNHVTAAGKTVSISNFSFTPKTVSVKVGTAVTWVDKDGTHTVTADDGSFRSPNLTAGKSFSHTFTRPGTYRYYCSFHGGAGGVDMSGVVTVTK